MLPALSYVYVIAPATSVVSFMIVGGVARPVRLPFES